MGQKLGKPLLFGKISRYRLLLRASGYAEWDQWKCRPVNDICDGLGIVLKSA